MSVIKSIVDQNLEVNDITGTTYSDWVDVQGAITFSAQCVVDVNTPIAKTFAAADVDVSGDFITLAAHGYPTGLKVQISNPGTLPVGISAATDYFVISLSTNTFALATSLALALAGTKLPITGQGVGTNTITPTALAGASVKLQKTNDVNVTPSDEGSATNITVDAVVWLEKVNPSSKYMRVAYTLTAGSMSSDNYVLVKGPN